MKLRHPALVEDRDRGLVETLKSDEATAGFAIYGLLKGAQASKVAEDPADYGDNRAKEIAHTIEHTLEPHVVIVDWSNKTDVQREMRRRIKRRLPNELYSRTEQDRLTAALIDLLRVRKGR